jgi:hypothetical protein
MKQARSLRFVIPFVLVVGTIVGINSTASAEERVVCTAQKVADPVPFLPANVRARVKCTQIPRSKKIRPKLDVKWDTDNTGDWFTATNVWFYVKMGSACPFGCTATYDVANR